MLNKKKKIKELEYLGINDWYIKKDLKKRAANNILTPAFLFLKDKWIMKWDLDKNLINEESFNFFWSLHDENLTYDQILDKLTEANTGGIIHKEMLEILTFAVKLSQKDFINTFKINNSI